MIEKIKHWFTQTLTEDSLTQIERTTDDSTLSAIALMIEIMAVDGQKSAAERDVVKDIVSHQLNLSSEQAEKIILQAEQSHQQATDFYHFTADINETYSAEEKIALIESLWRVAHADHHIDDLEQHVIRKLASLLYVSHKDFIASKLRVLET
jgi:uncharacterized tellurite resistance protein B-like protein